MSVKVTLSTESKPAPKPFPKLMKGNIDRKIYLFHTQKDATSLSEDVNQGGRYNSVNALDGSWSDFNGSITLTNKPD